MAVPLCSGDCDGDGTVGVSELVLGVNIALGSQVLAQCPAMDSRDSNEVQVADLVGAVGNALNGCPVVTCTPPAGGRCVEIDPGDGAQDALLTALLGAQPNDVIFIKAGTYDITQPLSLQVDNVTIAGEGMKRTVLSFKNQAVSGESLFVQGNGFTLQDIGLEDGPGDLFKVMGADGVTIRDVRAEWTNGPATGNGAYGFYPSQCRNVLVEDSIAEGASDTGIYVGQSRDIIVRRNRVELNVSGIEIENSVDADVDDNVVTRNTGGILVFDTPGPPAQGGRRTRVLNNQIYANNTPNFAPSGNTVAVVPTGTGAMVLANDQVEMFGNAFRDNNTTHIILISYNTAAVFGEPKSTNPDYDPYSETIFVHANTFEGGGSDPDPRLTTFGIVTLNGGLPLPDILYDGDMNPAEVTTGGQLPDNLRTCVQEQAGTTMLNLDLAHGAANVNHDLSALACTQVPLSPAVVSGRHIVISAGTDAQDQLETALIGALPGDDILIKAGTYELTQQLSLTNVDHVTLRGEGMGQTILRFNGVMNAESVQVTNANDFTLRDLAIEDSPGDQFKIIGADGVRVQRVRTEWTLGPDTGNGGYGIYPVQCRDVLVEQSVARGASDTGIYVGQSQHIVIRNNDAEYNVAGIEIENSTGADVHDNVATNNAGGILVFNLPGLQVYGERTHVFDNMSFANNTTNFAPKGNIVGGVPTGTGFMVLANDQVEASGNSFSNNNTAQVILVSYNSAEILAGLPKPTDPTFDPYSESLYIHDNTYMGGGTMPPTDPTFKVLTELLGLPIPQIVYDGDVDPAKLKNGILPNALRTCIQESAAAPPTFVNLNVPTLSTTPNIVRDLAPFNCMLNSLPQITIPGLP